MCICAVRVCVCAADGQGKTPSPPVWVYEYGCTSVAALSRSVDFLSGKFILIYLMCWKTKTAIRELTTPPTWRVCRCKAELSAEHADSGLCRSLLTLRCWIFISPILCRCIGSFPAPVPPPAFSHPPLPPFLPGSPFLSSLRGISPSVSSRCTFPAARCCFNLDSIAQADPRT